VPDVVLGQQLARDIEPPLVPDFLNVAAYGGRVGFR
jgi:hypothetical protein